MPTQFRVWDLPTRVFHGLLILSVSGLILTGHLGGSAMVWHMRLGLLVLALLVFRLVWGFVGGHWSQFANFVRGPATVWRTLRAGPKVPGSIGHSPLAGWSVLAMLAGLLAQVASGLLADDEIATAGPLSALASSSQVELATHFHTRWGIWLIYGLIGLHLAAIAFYTWRRSEGLVRAMLTGDKALGPDVGPPSKDNPAARWAALALFALALLLSYGVSRLG